MAKKYMTRHDMAAHALAMAIQLGNGWKIKLDSFAWWEINAVRDSVTINFNVYAKPLYRANFVFEGKKPAILSEKGATVDQAHEKLILRMKKLRKSLERNING